MFINKTLWLNNSKTKRAMNAKISILVICVEAITYVLLHNLHDSTLNLMHNICFVLRIFLRSLLIGGRGQTSALVTKILDAILPHRPLLVLFLGKQIKNLS